MPDVIIRSPDRTETYDTQCVVCTWFYRMNDLPMTFAYRGVWISICLSCLRNFSDCKGCNGKILKEI